MWRRAEWELDRSVDLIMSFCQKGRVRPAFFLTQANTIYREIPLPAIEIVNISKKFQESLSRKKVTAVEDLSLSIRKGEVFGFLGPNGAGKSTTIKILLNLIFPDTGTAAILGKESHRPEVRKHVGYLPENPYFYDHLTAEELLWFGGSASGLDTKRIRTRTDELLEKVNLSVARRRSLRTYSKGMVQRAGIALALIHEPDVVILDEPMSGLDPVGRKMVGDIILEQKAAGKTVFFSSHILTDIERFCDRAGIIVGGKLSRVDQIEIVLRDGRTLESIFLEEVAKSDIKEMK